MTSGNRPRIATGIAELWAWLMQAGFQHAVSEDDRGVGTATGRHQSWTPTGTLIIQKNTPTGVDRRPA
jgi:hypothetical protein